MQIEFVGAAREVTGSCHVVRANGHTILLDCGMFQGRRAESDAKNHRLPVPVEEIDAVVLSHAHIDHAGRLPFLVAEGYDKRIWATAATRDLCAYMLADSAHIQEKDAEFLVRRGKDPVPPLYTSRDAMRVQELMVGVPYHQSIDVVPGVRATFVDAGHILGSASVVLDVTEGNATKRLVFSGDVGRSGLAIIRDPQPPGGAHAVIMESTYGDRDHESVEGARETLGRVVRETAARGGRVLVPSFAVGRAQELIYDLHQLARDRAIPEIPIVVDSPLAVDTTTVFEAHPEVFDRGEALVRASPRLFRFPLLRYTRTVEESKALSAERGPMVIIAASGMAESGRILHHLAQGASDPRNTVMIVGYQAEHTLGRRIVERRETLKIFGEPVPLRARVEVLNGYSAHADRAELRAWLDAVRAGSPALGSVYLVHGEPPAQEALQGSLTAAGYDVRVPAPGIGRASDAPPHSSSLEKLHEVWIADRTICRSVDPLSKPRGVFSREELCGGALTYGEGVSRFIPSRGMHSTARPMTPLSSIDALVIAGGLGAITWVLWYFFAADRAAAVAAPSAEVTVVVRGGYEPSTIRVKAGAPVRLVFDRRETAGCSEEVVFPDFGLKRFLPANRRTTLELTPPAPGTYEFTCGMSMLRGRVIAE